MSKYFIIIYKIIILSILTILPSVYASTNLVKTYESGENKVYKAQYNNDGTIFVNNTLEKIYLGKDCDSYAAKYGKGTWGQANGGIIIWFKDKEIVFPKQELNMLIKTNCPI